MKSKLLRALILPQLLIASFFATPEAVSEPKPLKADADVQVLFNKSDLVAIGRVIEVETISENKAPGPAGRESIETVAHKKAVVSLIRSYKGSISPAITVEFTTELPSPSRMYGPELQEGETDLLFLSPSADGAYRFADQDWGKYRISGFSSPSRESMGLDSLQNDLVYSLAGNNDAAESALDVLLGFRDISNETERILVPLTMSSDVSLAAKSFTVLLRAKKGQYYGDLVRFLSQHGHDLPGESTMSLFGRIADPAANADPKAIAQLSTSSIPAIKLAGMYGLRKLRSPAAIHTLIAHLNDPDSNIQYLAVMALNDSVQLGEGYGPSNPQFDKTPQVYTARWQKWWDEIGRSQYSPE